MFFDISKLLKVFKGVIMQRGLNVLLILLLVIMVSSSITFAGVNFRIDMDTSTPGYQDTILALPGNTFTSNIEAILDSSADTLSSFSYSVWWDTAELSTPTITDITTFPLGSSWSDWGYVEIASPYIKSFTQVHWTSFAEGPITQIVASINWTASNLVTDGNLDVNIGFYNSGVDGAYDKNGIAVTPTFTGGSVNLAPEPISSMLFLSGGAILTLRRYLKKKKRC